jgi:hypothetical protein
MAGGYSSAFGLKIFFRAIKENTVLKWHFQAALAGHKTKRVT